MLVESSSAGDVYYVYGNGLISEHRGSDVNTYHFDYRGSTVAMTDARGSVKGTASYDEYGVKLSNTLATRFTYNGQFGVEDDGTGMYYMRTRYYNVDLKRFMNRDVVVVGSVSSAQSLNRYAYVNGNPISYTDPFGMARETLEQTQGLAGFDIHLLLDVAGMIPVIGEFADATNAVLYLSKGQYGNAALSGAAMVPFAGNFVTGGKLGVKASGMLSSSKEALRRTLNSVLDFKFNVGRSTELAGYGRVSNDVSIRDTYQYFASKARKPIMPLKNGTFVGDRDRGNGKWYTDDKELLKVTKGDPVVFKDFYPDFTPWSVKELVFDKGVLTGNHQKDNAIVRKRLVEDGSFKNQKLAGDWLKEKKLTFHHVDEVRGQLVPTILNSKVKHTGGAAMIRNK